MKNNKVNSNSKSKQMIIKPETMFIKIVNLIPLVSLLGIVVGVVFLAYR